MSNRFVEMCEEIDETAVLSSTPKKETQFLIFFSKQMKTLEINENI